MDQLLYLLLGWLLGLLSPGIAERIQRKHRRNELIDSVMGELHELRHTMAFVAYFLREHLGLAADEFLDWLVPLVQGYDGPDADPEMANTMVKLREMPEDRRRYMHLAQQGPNMGLSLKEYSVPFLLADVNEISICPLEFQRRVFRVKRQLDLFNQQVVFLRTQYEKTFDPSITGANRKTVESNLDKGYEQLASAARRIADAASDVISAWGKSSSSNKGTHPTAAQEPGGG